LRGERRKLTSFKNNKFFLGVLGKIVVLINYTVKVLINCLHIMNNRVAYLVSKKLTGEISETERLELNDFLIHDTDLYETIGLLEIAWQQELPTEQDSDDLERILHKLRSKGLGFVSEIRFSEGSDETLKFQESKRKSGFFHRISFLRMAAAIIFMVVASWLGYRFMMPSHETTTATVSNEIINQVTTKPGNRTRVVLRDGTNVWLNADSKLTYANDFGGTTREVNLTGEAYFDVVSSPDHPFIIHTPRTTVKVTGTTFNVRDYPGEARTETSLIKGKVEVRPIAQPDKVYYLKPLEKIIFQNEEKAKSPMGLVSKTIKDTHIPDIAEIVRLDFDIADSMAAETAWINDQLAFNNESFKQVAEKMEKWYNTKIIIESPSLEVARFTGKFEKESLQEALEALQYTTPFRFRRQGQTIVIYKKTN
jgi:transmembrane sensor